MPKSNCIVPFLLGKKKNIFPNIKKNIDEAITFKNIETIIEHINCKIKLLEIDQIRSLKKKLEKKSKIIKNDIIKKEIGLLTKEVQFNLEVAEVVEQVFDSVILENPSHPSHPSQKKLKKKRDRLTKERSEHTRKLKLLENQKNEIIKKNEFMYNSILEKIILLDNIIISSVAYSVLKPVKKITRAKARSVSQLSVPQSSVSQSSVSPSSVSPPSVSPPSVSPPSVSPLSVSPPSVSQRYVSQRYAVGGKPVNKKTVNKKLGNKKLVNKKPV